MPTDLLTLSIDLIATLAECSSNRRRSDRRVGQALYELCRVVFAHVANAVADGAFVAWLGVLAHDVVS